MGAGEVQAWSAVYEIPSAKEAAQDVVTTWKRQAFGGSDELYERLRSEVVRAHEAERDVKRLEGAITAGSARGRKAVDLLLKLESTVGMAVASPGTRAAYDGIGEVLACWPKEFVEERRKAMQGEVKP